MTVTARMVYESSDGIQFDNERDAEGHETELQGKKFMAAKDTLKSLNFNERDLEKIWDHRVPVRDYLDNRSAYER